jgi:hypothetical protein
VLAGTGALNLYIAADQRQPAPLTGDLDLIPDLTFGERAAPIRRSRPAPVDVGTQFLRRNRSSS